MKTTTGEQGCLRVLDVDGSKKILEDQSRLPHVFAKEICVFYFIGKYGTFTNYTTQYHIKKLHF